MKKLLYSLLLGMFATSSMNASDYGLPAAIQDGNILHCFNWPANEVKNALPQIAAAGFGSVQLSPLQRRDSRVGSEWHNLYRPYDLAFMSSSFCTENDLKELCTEAAKYGIKVIVDIVANHVDKTSGYHDSWWDANGRVRWNGGINYGDRYSITHGQLGDYGDINSELSEVCARGKAYVEKLKSLGVAGCRWDAAKHIGLPSEGCEFWSSVTSVPGMWHYGEILDSPGPNPSIIKEYVKFMSVTDNKYCNAAARDNGGIPGGYGGDWAVNQGCDASKLVYWAESHDTYANDEWSQNVDQATIDRAYAAYACRNGATALYLSRPNAKGFSNIKVGKGSTAFTAKHIAEVNKFRNMMVGKKDWFESNGNACSITRQDGGAVIVMRGSGNVTIANGGGYCPPGTYKDQVSGGTFTVTSSTISGNVGASGIAVIYKDGIQPPIGGGDDPIITPPSGSVTITGDYNLAYNGTLEKVYWWPGCTTAYPGVKMDVVKGSDGNDYKVAKLPAGVTGLLFATNGDGDKTGDLEYTGEYVMNDNGATSIKVTFTNGGGGDDPINPPVVGGDEHYIYYDGTFSNPTVWAWTSSANCNSNNSWPGDAMTKKDGKWYWALPAGKSVPENVIISENGGEKIGGGDLNYVDKATYHQDGTCSEGGDPVPTKPVVTASPTSGTSFTETLKVTFTVTPAADIYYTLDGTAASESSTKYNGAISLSGTTTINTLAVTADGGRNAQTFSYTKRNIDDPIPPVNNGNNLITEYYKVNPNGQSGSNRTINMNFNEGKSLTALTNWTDADLIAQGVARDICQAFKGVHERPIVDSYALYAAYDSQNLYLGVQYVYTVWDLYGEGKQPGESKPYNMDGKLCFAFDLDPNKSAKGITNENSSIWQNKIYTTFDNGSDAWWYGSTKPGSGTPGFFVPNASGICDYSDPNSCKVSTVKYGHADGLLPSITAVYGQNDFSYEPDLLKGNTGFVDLRSDIPDSAHTFYEFTFPLSLLGVTEDYIKNNGIGVMVVDFYGSSAHASIPYDPCFYDNVFDSYSQDPSSSAEKEDKDVVTYSHARIGKMDHLTNIEVPVAAEISAESEPMYYTLQGVRVENPSNGIYIVVRGNKVTKEVIK